jgi:hypothetical protein
MGVKMAYLELFLNFVRCKVTNRFIIRDDALDV